MDIACPQIGIERWRSGATPMCRTLIRSHPCYGVYLSSPQMEPNLTRIPVGQLLHEADELYRTREQSPTGR